MIEQTAVLRLRWRTGLIGCLLPIMICACGVFGFAAFDSSFAHELGEGRRGGLFRATQAVTVAGINIPLALITIYLCCETFRFAWRWADEIAIEMTPSGLRPHRSTLLRPLAWSEISDVSFMDVGRGASLVIRRRNGSTLIIRGVDNENSAAEKFAAHACRMGALADSGSQVRSLQRAT